MVHELRDRDGAARSLPKKFLVIVPVALLLFGIVLQVSVVRAFSHDRPAIALALAPYDSQALSVTAAAAILANQAQPSRDRARDLSIRAIQRDPTSVAALRTLALVRELDGDPEAAARLMQQSETYSRRDLLTQLWLIEHFSRANDVPRTLRHYDTAMRTSNRARQMLIPTLVSASEDPELQPSIRAVVAQKPQWWRAFANALISDGGLDSAAVLTNALLDPRVPEDRALVQNLISRTATQNRPDLAWRAFTSARLYADRKWIPGAIRNGGFESDDMLPIFDWVLAEDPELSGVRIQRPTREGGFALQLIANGRSGDVAFQMLHLPAGDYALEFTAGGLEGARATTPTISISCTAGSRGALATAGVSSRRGQVGSAKQQFTVPANCAFQWLAVRANNAGEGQEDQVWIDDVTVRSAR